MNGMHGMRRREPQIDEEVRSAKGRRAAGGFSAGLKIFQPRITRIRTNEEDRDGGSSILLIPFIPSSLPPERKTGLTG